MIISASRRTDIPALYSEWFMNRIREGYLFVRNPYNAHQFRRVDLSLGNVDVIVFWTKNPRPIVGYLDELDKRGYRYYFQFTLTGYPKLLEPSVPPVYELLTTFRTLSQRIGPEKVIWRFDPITLSDVTPEHAVIENFERLARELRDSTLRVVISFVHLYENFSRNLARITEEQGIRFYDRSRSGEQVQRIAAALAGTARRNSIEIVSCAAKFNLTGLGIEHGKCVDDQLVKRLFGIAVSGRKDKFQRKECRCVESQDIGQYNTCTHDCIYCYANFNKKQAHQNKSLHDPTSPFLIGRGETAGAGTTDHGQMNLFSPKSNDRSRDG
jgi:DNA repair photolyase